MERNNLISIIQEHSLHIDEENEIFASKFVNIEGYKPSKAQERVLLRTWYDGYLFCLWLGITANRRKEKFKLKEKARRWNDSRINQYVYLITKALSKKEVLMELELTSKESIIENNITIQSLGGEIKVICDQFAFGGLEYLREMYEFNDELFDDTEYFETIIRKLKLIPEN